MQSPSITPASRFRPAHAPGSIDVLILDDERFDRHRLARLCSGLDFPCAVHNAKSLAEFEDHLESEDFGLILLDYALPDGTGLDALSLLRLNARNLNTPTVMITGQPEDEVALRAQAAGCAAYLSKDALSSSDFAKAVRVALSKKSNVAPAQADQFTAAEVHALLGRATANAAQDIKPMVSRLMRQMRNLRASQTVADTTTLRNAEQDCLALWSLLIEMEREDGALLLSDMIGPQAERQPQQAAPVRSAPPSPFTTRKQ